MYLPQDYNEPKTRQMAHSRPKLECKYEIYDPKDQESFAEK